MKDNRSSQPCISMNFWTESSSSMWVSLAMSPAMCVHLVTMPLKSSYKLSSNKFGPPTFFIIFSLSPLAFFFSELIVLLLKTYLEYLIFRFLIDEPISKCLACLLTFIVKLLWTDLVLFTSSVNNRKFYFLSSVYSFFNVSQIHWRNILPSWWKNTCRFYLITRLTFARDFQLKNCCLFISLSKTSRGRESFVFNSHDSHVNLSF